MSAQREAFEAWAIEEGHFVGKDGAGDYKRLPAYWMWTAWQAAQAAMQAAEPAGWISVDERLPKPWDEVMVWPYPSAYCITAAYSKVKGWIYTVLETGHGGEDYACNVSHWMPVPDGPNDDETAHTEGAA